MFYLLLNNLIKFFVPLGLFFWALFMPKIASYIYLGIYGIFFLYLLIIDSMKPTLNHDKWTKDEIEIFKKYHLSLRFPFGARDMSCYLNGFRWAGFLWIILLLINQMWISSFIILCAFFLTSDMSVRLDPFFFLGQAVQNGQIKYAYELSLLQDISQRLNRFC